MLSHRMILLTIVGFMGLSVFSVTSLGQESEESVSFLTGILSEGPTIEPGAWKIIIDYHCCDVMQTKETMARDETNICYTSESANFELGQQLSTEWSSPVMPGLVCHETKEVKIVGQRIFREAECVMEETGQKAIIKSDYRIEGDKILGIITTTVDDVTVTVKTTGTRIGDCTR